MSKPMKKSRPANALATDLVPLLLEMVKHKHFSDDARARAFAVLLDLGWGSS